MSGNAALDPPLEGLALEYSAWKGWRYKVYGRFHPVRRKRMAAYARQSLRYAGKMRYTEGPTRSELFHRKPGNFATAAADCSQYVSALAHWCGVKKVTDEDWTGSLYSKGKVLTKPVPGCVVIFGVAPGVHAAYMVGKGMTIGFGDQAAPSYVSLSGMLDYFARHGHPGHAFRDLTRG